MKFVAYILSFYILFLAMGPGVKAMYASLNKQELKTDCCSKCSSNKEDGSNKKEKPSPDENATHNCNPLEACGTCSGYTVNFQISLSILPVFYADKPSGIVQDKIFSDFASDFWQPPRLS